MSIFEIVIFLVMVSWICVFVILDSIYCYIEHRKYINSKKYLDDPRKENKR